jgi:hypothetical protein
MTVEKMQNRPKVTVWCGMAATNVIGPCLMRDTMNSEHYLQMPQDYVWPTISGWENIDDLIFIQDGARITLQMPYMCGWMGSFQDVG